MFWIALGIAGLCWLLGDVQSVAASAVLYLAILAMLGVMLVAILQGRPPFRLR
jgi:hypothetical protein